MGAGDRRPRLRAARVQCSWRAVAAQFGAKRYGYDESDDAESPSRERRRAAFLRGWGGQCASCGSDWQPLCPRYWCTFAGAKRWLRFRFIGVFGPARIPNQGSSANSTPIRALTFHKLQRQSMAPAHGPCSWSTTPHGRFARDRHPFYRLRRLMEDFG